MELGIFVKNIRYSAVLLCTHNLLLSNWAPCFYLNHIHLFYMQKCSVIFCLRTRWNKELGLSYHDVIWYLGTWTNHLLDSDFVTLQQEWIFLIVWLPEERRCLDNRGTLNSPHGITKNVWGPPGECENKYRKAIWSWQDMETALKSGIICILAEFMIPLRSVAGIWAYFISN